MVTSLKVLFSLSVLFLMSCADVPEDPNEEDLSHLCSIENLEGECPGARLCRAGACVIDFDPGAALTGDKTARWDELWNYYDTNYAAFLAKPNLDWNVVLDETHQALDDVTSEFQFVDVVSRAVERIGDGHAQVQGDVICNADPGFGDGNSNVGACVIEGEEGLLVYKTSTNSPFEMGDVLLSIDERSPELLINDAVEQTRCFRGTSTDAQLRQSMVASLLFRDADDAVAVVQRDGDEIELTLSPENTMRCDGRLDDEERTLLGNEVETKVLDGNVLYIRLSFFRSIVGGEAVSEPVIDALRIAFEDARDRNGIVFDLRGNPGGLFSVYFAIISWLFDTPETIFTCRQKDGPNHNDLSGFLDGGVTLPDPDLYVQGRLALLTDGLTYSAADFTSHYLQEQGRSRNFGLPSGGGFGAFQSTAISGVSAGNNYLICEDQNGELLEGNPPAVDEVVLHSVASLRANRDPILEAARRFAGDQ